MKTPQTHPGLRRGAWDPWTTMMLRRMRVQKPAQGQGYLALAQPAQDEPFTSREKPSEATCLAEGFQPAPAGSCPAILCGSCCFVREGTGLQRHNEGS